jgi:hypothetical protein
VKNNCILTVVKNVAMQVYHWSSKLMQINSSSDNRKPQYNLQSIVSPGSGIKTKPVKQNFTPNINEEK